MEEGVQTTTDVPHGTIPVYDISGHAPVLGTIAPEEVQDAISSGHYSFPKGMQVSVLDPEGKPGTIDAAEAPQAFAAGGYKYATPDDINKIKFGTPTEQAKAALEGVGQGVLGPLAPAIERGMGVPAQNILNRREANPMTHTVGEGIGLAGSSMLGYGAGAALEKAGVGAAGALGLGGEGAGIASNIGAHSVSGMAQMALLQAGDETSRFIENDPTQSAGVALTDIGLSGLIGAGGGAAFGAISPLWKAVNGEKMVRYIEDFKSQLGTRLANPNPAEALHSELADYYGKITSAADEVYGPRGLKQQAIEKLMPEATPDNLKVISNNAMTMNANAEGAFKEMADQGVPERLLRKFQNDLEKFQNVITDSTSAPAEIFDATQNFKQKLQLYSKFEKMIPPTAEDYDFVQSAKKLQYKLRASLEDENVWGKAAEVQKDVNAAFKQYIDPLKDFNKKFTSEILGDKVVDTSKINTYVNQLGKPNAELKQEMLKNFIEASEKYKNTIEKIHGKLGIESPFEPTSLNHVNASLDKLSPGAKAANVIVDKALSPLIGKSAGAGIGGLAGSTVGHGYLGALVGEHVLGGVFSSILPGIIKPILENAASAGGFKTAIRLGTAISKGEKMLNTGVKAIFKGEAKVLPKGTVLPLKERKKIDDQLQSYKTDNDKWASLGGEAGHYMPSHNTELVASAARAINYLNGLKPNTDKIGMMGPSRQPSAIETSKYNRAMDIAEQPMSVLQHIQDSTLTPDDVNTLKTISPGLYARMSQKLVEQLNDHISSGKPVPYRTQLGLSLFLGQPLDPSGSGQAIALNQPDVPQQPQSQQKTGRGSHNVTALNKLAPSYQTPDQNRSTRRSMS